MSEIVDAPRGVAAPAAIPTLQGDWRSCTKCQGFFFDGLPDPGACAAGGRHSAAVTPYAMLYDGRGSGHVQDGWRSCPKCRGLYYAGFADQGRCPGGGTHVATGSFDYRVPFAQPIVPQAQNGWRSCFRCNSLYYGFGNSVCAAGGPHDPTRSFDYSVWIDA